MLIEKVLNIHIKSFYFDGLLRRLIVKVILVYQ